MLLLPESPRFVLVEEDLESGRLMPTTSELDRDGLQFLHRRSLAEFVLLAFVIMLDPSAPAKLRPKERLRRP